MATHYVVTTDSRDEPSEAMRDQASEAMDDETLVREGGKALRERLGVMGTLRYLRLLGGGRDRWEDICKAWRGVSMDEALRQMGLPPEPEEDE